MQLRPYQEAAVEAVEQAWEEARSTLLVLPTGTGKTVVFAHLIDRLPPGRRALVIAHREELVWQAASKIERITGVKPDVEMADYRAAEHRLIGKAPFVVSTVQTQVAGRNGNRRMHRFNPREFGLLVIDEAHHAPAKSYRTVIDYYAGQNPDLRVLGVTATPDRKDEAALGAIFDSCAFDFEIVDAIQAGWLVPICQRAVVVEDLDYSSVRTTAGDLNESDLSRILEYEDALHGIAYPSIEITNGLKPGTLDRLVKEEQGGGRPAPEALGEILAGPGVRPRQTLVFAVTVAHAERLTEILNRWIPESARIVHGKTPKDERRNLFRDYARGRFQYLCNVGVATEGFDEPGIETIVMARPTKSRALYAQMVGRGTRPLPGLVDGQASDEGRRLAIEASGKPFLEVIDFVGNAGRHHLVTGADVLGGRHPDAVIKRAKQAAEKAGGKPVDLLTELEKAEQQIAEEQERKRRRHVRVAARYSSTTVDPFALFNVKPRRERGWNAGKEPTEKQLAFLKRQGIDTRDLSRGKASQLIDTLVGRFKKDRCTYKQAKTLVKFGYDPDVGFKEASEIIDGIAKNGWRRPDPEPAATGVDVDAIPL